jgi:transposase
MHKAGGSGDILSLDGGIMFYLGIDVSKAKLDCCLIRQDTPDKRKSKVVANSVAGVGELIGWLARQGAHPQDTHALLEGTGVYHETAATALDTRGVRVSILNPAQVRDFGKGLGLRSKNDTIDAWLLARFGLLQRPAPWQPPAPQVRVLRALVARRQAVQEDLQRERNRMEKARSTETPRLVLQSLQEGIAFLERQMIQLQDDIDQHIDGDPELKRDDALLQSIPAVGPKVASHMLCVMRLGTFGSAERLAAYLGVVPVERQSGTSVLGKSRLSKAGPPLLRAQLYMAAIVGIRHNPHVKALYERLLARGKSKMAALGAAMRKIVHLCFGVLKNQTPYRKDFASAS